MALCGGFKLQDGVSDDHREMANLFKESISKTAGKELTTFNVVKVKTQVVAGTMFKLAIEIQDGELIHAKVFVPLPHTGREPELKSVECGKKPEDAF